MNHKAPDSSPAGTGPDRPGLGTGGTGLSVAISGWLSAHQTWLRVEYLSIKKTPAPQPKEAQASGIMYEK